MASTTSANLQPTATLSVPEVLDTALPELPSVPTPVIIFCAIAAGFLAATTALLYFAVFPPFFPRLRYIGRLVEGLRGWATKKDHRYEEIPLDDGYFSHRSMDSDELDRNAEFEWLLKRAKFDEESQSPRPKPGDYRRGRARSSPSRPMVNGWESLPVTPKAGLRQHDQTTERGRVGLEHNTTRDVLAEAKEPRRSFWQRLDNAVEWASERAISYALEDTDVEGLLLQISGVEKMNADSVVCNL